MSYNIKYMTWIRTSGVASFIFAVEIGPCVRACEAIGNDDDDDGAHFFVFFLLNVFRNFWKKKKLLNSKGAAVVFGCCYYRTRIYKLQHAPIRNTDTSAAPSTGDRVRFGRCVLRFECKWEASLWKPNTSRSQMRDARRHLFLLSCFLPFQTDLMHRKVMQRMAKRRRGLP